MHKISQLRQERKSIWTTRLNFVSGVDPDHLKSLERRIVIGLLRRPGGITDIQHDSIVEALLVGGRR